MMETLIALPVPVRGVGRIPVEDWWIRPRARTASCAAGTMA